MTKQTYKLRYTPTSPEKRNGIKRRMSCREPRSGQRNLGSYLAQIEGLRVNREPSFFQRARFGN